MEKNLKITKEEVKVEDEKVYIDSEELANAIKNTEANFFSEEQIAWNIPICEIPY